MPAYGLLLSIQRTCLAPGPGAEMRISLRSTPEFSDPPSLAVTVIRTVQNQPDQVVFDDYFEALTHTFVYSPAPDGDYRIVAVNHEGYSQTTNYTIACGGDPSDPSACDILVVPNSLVATNATTVGGNGMVRLLVSTTAASFTATLTNLADNSQQVLPTTYTPGLLVIAPVPVGSYRLDLRDARACTAQALFTIGEPVVLGGCTDTLATNYNAAATFENGSCEYTPPVRTPVFRVPRLNPLRFVLEADTDNCAVFETIDNVRFCEQRRPGQQLRPLYRHKVQYCDPTTVQVHTDFDAVTAEIRRARTDAIVRTVDFELVQRHTGLSDALAVTLSEYPGGFTALITTTEELPLTLRRSTRVTLSGAATGTYRVREVATTTAGELVLVLNRPWEVPAAGTTQVQWQLSTVNFNVWEAALNWAGLAEGDYYVTLRGTDAVAADVVATSEPIWLAAEHANTIVIELASKDNCFGMVWSTGLVVRHRLVGTFFLPDPAGSSTVHRSSSGAATLLTSTAQRRIILRTGTLPDYLHELLFVGLRLDRVRVQGQCVLAEGDYTWSRVEGYPLSAGTITLEVEGGFGTGNGDDDGSLPDSSTDSLLALRRGGFLKLRS